MNEQITMRPASAINFATSPTRLMFSTRSASVKPRSRLSGAGKSTIADIVEKKLLALGRHTMLLDGDNVRHGLTMCSSGKGGLPGKNALGARCSITLESDRVAEFGSHFANDSDRLGFEYCWPGAGQRRSFRLPPSHWWQAPTVGREQRAALKYQSPAVLWLTGFDTCWKFREMIAFRDATARRLGLDLVVHTNEEGRARGIDPITSGSALHTAVMKMKR
jgi:hypothetical protein